MATDRDNYWTVPNALTLIRLVIAVYLFQAVMTWESEEIKAWLFEATTWAAAAFATDWIDGKISRKWPSQSSRIGAALDPIADKASVIAYLAYLFAADVFVFGLQLEVFLVGAIVVREVIVSGLRILVGHANVPVVRGGKVKTTLQMFAMLVYGLLPELSSWVVEAARWLDYRIQTPDVHTAVWIAAISLLGAATYQTVATGWGYLRPFMLAVRV